MAFNKQDVKGKLVLKDQENTVNENTADQQAGQLLKYTILPSTSDASLGTSESASYKYPTVSTISTSGYGNNWGVMRIPGRDPRPVVYTVPGLHVVSVPQYFLVT